MSLLPKVSRTSFLVQGVPHTTVCLDNDTIVSPQKGRSVHDAAQNTSFAANQVPTAQLATSCVIAPPAPQGQKDRPQAHFPDSSEIPCRCNKSTAGPMLLEKQRLEIAQLPQTVMDLNSQGPKDHTWCRHRAGPLSKAPHNRTGSHETQTGT